MIGIHLYSGTVLVRTVYCDLIPAFSEVRELMSLRSADRAVIARGSTTIATIV